MGDENQVEVKIVSTADTAGLEKAASGLQDLKTEAAQSGDVFVRAQAVMDAELAKVTAGAGEAAKGTGKLNEVVEDLSFRTFREGAHAAHGLETAFEGGHMSTLRWVMSLRGLSELLTGNEYIAALTAVSALSFGLYEWAKHEQEAQEKIREAEEAVGESADAARGKLDEASAAAEKVTEPAHDWKTDTEDTLKALKAADETYEKIHASMTKMLDASEKLALAQNAARSDLSDQEKASNAFGIQAFYGGLKDQDTQALYDKQIENQKALIAAQDAAGAAANDDLAQKSARMQDLTARSKEYVTEIEKAQAMLSKSKAEHADEINHTKSLTEIGPAIEQMNKDWDAAKNWLTSQGQPLQPTKDSDGKAVAADISKSQLGKDAAQAEADVTAAKQAAIDQGKKTAEMDVDGNLKLQELQQQKEAAKIEFEAQQKEKEDELAKKLSDDRARAEQEALKKKQERDKEIADAIARESKEDAEKAKKEAAEKKKEQPIEAEERSEAMDIYNRFKGSVDAKERQLADEAKGTATSTSGGVQLQALIERLLNHVEKVQGAFGTKPEDKSFLTSINNRVSQLEQSWETMYANYLNDRQGGS